LPGYPKDVNNKNENLIELPHDGEVDNKDSLASST